MKKSLKIFIVTAVLLISATVVFFVGINIYVIKSSQSRILDAPFDTDYDCIIVLGAGIRADGTPTAMLEDRLKRASELYFSGASEKILVTGDNGRIEYNETYSMKKYLTDELGVPNDAVVCDYAGFSTYDSMYRAKEIFCVKKALVVTQQYHLYRAVYIARRLGIEINGVASDYRRYGGQRMRDLRELAARTKDFFSTVIKPKPKYLGEKLPIRGE